MDFEVGPTIFIGFLETHQGLMGRLHLIPSNKGRLENINVTSWPVRDMNCVMRDQIQRHNMSYIFPPPTHLGKKVRETEVISNIECKEEMREDNWSVECCNPDGRPNVEHSRSP